jgi:transcription termination factor Rho
MAEEIKNQELENKENTEQVEATKTFQEATTVVENTEQKMDKVEIEEKKEQTEKTEKKPSLQLEYTYPQLMEKTLAELQKIGKELGLSKVKGLKKSELVKKILEKETEKHGLNYVEGVLDIRPEGYGFLRYAENHYTPSPQDTYVPPNLIKKLGLRTGDDIIGFARPPREGEKYQALIRVEAVNGIPPYEAKRRPLFEKLVPYHPTERFNLEYDPSELSTRVVSLIAPIGKGQRGLIVAPPKAGKTTLLQKIATAIIRNHPEVYLMILLIDERPEEVTEMKRIVAVSYTHLTLPTIA